MSAFTVNRRMTGKEWLALLVLSVFWAGSFFFVGVQVKALPPFTIVSLRVGLAAIILNIFLKALGKRMPAELSVWRAFFGMGMLNNAIPFCLVVWGQSHIASGLAAILNATTPLWTVIVAHFLTDDEKITANRLLGIAIGFITATGQVTASAILLVPLAVFVDTPWTLAVPPCSVWGAAIGAALFSTALGYVLYFRILATAGATNLLLVTFLIPVSAILLGAYGLGEHLEIRHFAGLACIGAGLAAIDGRFFIRHAVEAR